MMKQNEDLNIFQKISLLGTLGVALFGAPSGSEAATYNFYFNNTEQGPGSNATPQLNVQGAQGAPSAAGVNPSAQQIPPYPQLPGTLVSPPVAPQMNAGPDGQSLSQTLPAHNQAPLDPGETPSEASGSSPQTTPVSPAPTPQIVPPAPLLDSADSSLSASTKKKKSWWDFKTRDWVKISVAGGMLKHWNSYFALDGFDENEGGAYGNAIYQDEYMSIGGELSILPSRYLSLNGWGGVATSSYDGEILPFWGGDLRIIPVRIGLFGMDNFLELSAGIGATSLAARDSFLASGYAVANATFGLGMDDVFLSVTWKANKGFELLEAGVGYRF